MDREIMRLHQIIQEIAGYCLTVEQFNYVFGEGYWTWWNQEMEKEGKKEAT